MKQGFLFGAGSFYGLHKAPASGDLILAADGGYRLCQTLGLAPHLLMGDFDSMDVPTDCDHIVKFPVEKDDTDAMLIIKEALAQGCDTLHLYGMTGGNRLDHTLATMQSLLYIRRHGAKGYAYDHNFIFTVIENETITLEKEVDWGILSLFPLDGSAKGITLRGVQYPLTNGTLPSSFPLGVSNHILAPTASITVETGALLVGWEVLEKS